LHSRAILKTTIPLNKAIEQWGNLGALVSALYTEDYELLSRSIQDKVIEPYRAMLIPKFEETRQAALNSGALGSGISGSGPSIFALSKGIQVAKKVGLEMEAIYKDLDLDYQLHLSKINTEGIKVLNRS
jgi:homoserine kinase